MIAPGLLDEKIDPSMLTEIAHEIAEVEAILQSEMSSQVALVAEVCSHTLSAGGKRLRPALVTLAAKATGRPFDPLRARRLGACMEMIHMATLMHDDVIDGAATRRGRRTACIEFGSTAAILSGDVLLAKAMAILARDGDLSIIRMVAEAVVELAEGEVSELETRHNLEMTEAEHRSILRKKTASFTEACCRTGSKIADAPEDVEDALGRYGHHLGIAFQLVDDLLDYRGRQDQTGKPRATDYREACPTLPLIALLPALNEAERAFVRRTFGESSDADVDKVASLMEERGAFDYADLAAESEVDEAQRAASELPPSVHRDVLNAVARFVRARKA